MKIIKEELRLEKDEPRLAQLKAKLDDALEFMGLEPGYSTREGWVYSLKHGIEVMESLTNQWPDRPDRGYRIVMIVGEPPPELPPENTSAKGTHLSLVRENKITKSRLRQIIKEEIEKEIRKEEIIQENLLSMATTLAKQGGLVMLLRQEKGRDAVSNILAQIGDFFSKASIPGLEREMKTLDAGLTTAANTLKKLTDEQLAASLKQVLSPGNIGLSAFDDEGKKNLRRGARFAAQMPPLSDPSRGDS